MYCLALNSTKHENKGCLNHQFSQRSACYHWQIYGHVVWVPKDGLQQLRHFVLCFVPHSCACVDHGNCCLVSSSIRHFTEGAVEWRNQFLQQQQGQQCNITKWKARKKAITKNNDDNTVSTNTVTLTKEQHKHDNNNNKAPNVTTERKQYNNIITNWYLNPFFLHHWVKTRLCHYFSKYFINITSVYCRRASRQILYVPLVIHLPRYLFIFGVIHYIAVVGVVSTLHLVVLTPSVQ